MGREAAAHIRDEPMKKPIWPPVEGLRFKCTGCGQCCTGGPGAVWLSEEDILRLLEQLQIPREEFLLKYTRKIGARISLKEDPDNYDCVFLAGKKCSLYQARPAQCRIYPWWPEVIESKEAWDYEKERCEGIDHPDGELYQMPRKK